MKVVKPIYITPSKIVSSNAAEVYSLWSSATTYSLGSRVIYSEYIYESLIASNLNKQPDTNPTAWLKIGPSNKYAMFDNQTSSQTTRQASLSVSFKPGLNFNTLALLNVNAASIAVVVRDGIGGQIIFQSTTSSDATLINDWYEYFFKDFEYRSDVIFYNIPMYLNAVVELTLTGTSSDIIAIGGCVVGPVYYIGGTQYGLNYGIRDYSLKETDDFGNVTFVERAFSKRMSPEIFVENIKLNNVTKLLTEIRASPTVWIATDDQNLAGTTIFGYYKDWRVVVNYPDSSLITIDIEGLT